jgi:hypothetical protein
MSARASATSTQRWRSASTWVVSATIGWPSTLIENGCTFAAGGVQASRSTLRSTVRVTGTDAGAAGVAAGTGGAGRAGTATAVSS